jgi:Arc/MetJ family transcription regulator
MRTTIDLDPKVLAEAIEYTGEKSPSRAVNKAVSEYVRRRKLDELRKMLGTLDLEDTLQADEEAELADMKRVADGLNRHLDLD